MGRQAFAALLVVALGTLVLAVLRVPETCPLGWDGAQRVAVAPRDATYIRVDALHVYQVGGSALLDYMPRIDTGPLVRLGPTPHPLNVVLSASASRENLERLSFACVRVTHGPEMWSVRPQNYGIESPQWDLPGASWRLAVASGGPEWPAGDTITMEAWILIAGRRYILDFEPITLMRGG